MVEFALLGGLFWLIFVLHLDFSGSALILRFLNALFASALAVSSHWTWFAPCFVRHHSEIEDLFILRLSPSYGRQAEVLWFLHCLPCADLNLFLATRSCCTLIPPYMSIAIILWSIFHDSLPLGPCTSRYWLRPVYCIRFTAYCIVTHHDGLPSFPMGLHLPHYFFG